MLNDHSVASQLLLSWKLCSLPGYICHVCGHAQFGLVCEQHGSNICRSRCGCWYLGNYRCGKHILLTLHNFKAVHAIADWPYDFERVMSMSCLAAFVCPDYFAQKKLIARSSNSMHLSNIGVPYRQCGSRRTETRWMPFQYRFWGCQLCVSN